MASPSATGSAARTNEQWVADLQGPDSQSEPAVADLHALIRRFLAAQLLKRGPVDEAQLDDLTQTAVVRVLSKLPTFRGASRFTTWAYSVAVRSAFSEIRRTEWRNVSLTDFSLPNSPAAAVADDATDAETFAQRRAVLRVLHRIISTELSDRQRQGILAELEGMPLAALEEKMQTSRNALYKLLHDARLKLRRGLESSGVNMEEVTAAFGL